MGTIPTVGIVTFTTNASGVTSAEIRFGLASTGPTMTAPVDLAQANYRTLLLGMKGSSSYVYRIVVSSSAGTCTSQDYTIMTGAVPSSVPKPTATISMAAAHSKGFIVTSSGISGTGAYIFDSDGAPVWWATGPSGTSRIQMSWDGSKMYMMALNVQNNGAGRVNTVNMDGSGATMISGMTGSHHDMTAIPGGFATLLWNSTGIDAPCSLVERADSGTMTTVVANMNTVYNSSTFHTNSVHYYPSDNTYTLGDRNPNLYVKVSRTGQLIWQLGGTNPKDAAKQFIGAGTWSVNHGHHLLADGTFVLFNNGSMMGSASTMRLFKLNTSNMTAMPRLHVHGERREQQRHGRRPGAPQREHPGDGLAVRSASPRSPPAARWSRPSRPPRSDTPSTATRSTARRRGRVGPVAVGLTLSLTLSPLRGARGSDQTALDCLASGGRKVS